MERHAPSLLITLALFATFWAYTIAVTLIRDLGIEVTYVDLAVLFILGLIAGFALGTSAAIRRKTG